MPHSDSQPLTMGMLELEKSNRMTWRSEWMPRHEKFSKKSLQALSSWNQTWDGVGSTKGEEEDAPEQKGFLGVIEQLTKEKERKGQTEKYQTI